MVPAAPLIALAAATLLAACGPAAVQRPAPPALVHSVPTQIGAAPVPAPPRRDVPQSAAPARNAAGAAGATAAPAALPAPARSGSAAPPPVRPTSPASAAEPAAAVALPPAGVPTAPSRAGRPVRRVALLFPAQGPRKAVGLEARRGAALCLEEAGGARGFRFEAVERDESAAADPAALVADLVDGQGVVALVGPLLSETVQRSLAAAEGRDLPLISPTAAAGRLGEGSRVFFRTCLTMDSYVEALAGFAAGRLGGATFATLAPADRYGRALAASFGPALEQRGGRVVLAREYAQGVRDLVPWAAGLAADLRPAGRADGWGVDAIFLAGSAQEAGMILPRLAHLGLDPRAVAVVGTSSLNVPEFPRLAGGYAEGALLADGFFAGSERPAARAFAHRYRERHGVAPGAAAAQACAAVEVLAAALGSGAATPGETLEALGRLGEVPTVLGPVRLRPGGAAERRPFFITVSGGKLVEIGEP